MDPMLMLSSHQQKLHGNMQGLRPSGTSHGVAYSATLSKLVFSTIAQAANDSLALFDDEPSYSSELPCVEQALYTNIKRIEQCTTTLAAAADWSLTCPPIGSRSLGTASLADVIASQPKLSSSAHKFNTMVQELCEDISPLEILQLSEQTLEGVMQVFNACISMLIKALPGSVDNENLEGSVNRIVRMIETEPEQIALLTNALLLADELIPRAATKLSSSQQSNNKTDDTSKRSTDPAIPSCRAERTEATTPTFS
ncbi:hypothetical protein RND71_010506 [Anisodus tanguticus]|uniref:Uncharacterized protein n=1 Tax=Anisodus tanguticus TaxID=243964 RepID=A0AAE1SLS4_9SOLA|nr:hypothetical protein RND71_010506 [Anisodus tanguticus]